MENDRELLEYAAKAAGNFHQHKDHKIAENLPVVFYLDGKPWNPLTDDGDALRLAVRLGMEVYIDNHPYGCSCTEAQSHTQKTKQNECRAIIDHKGDPYAATRRAIVRAAAEIGKAME